MTMEPGSRLGSYKILGPLGSGGMGEVYRARDEKLGREVAVKVLPEELSEVPEALARFQREARAVASLSHPNILAIHDFGSHDGRAYAVTELLEGETLRDRLLEEAMSVRKVVDYGAQIARGLAAAHAKGIIHRDLKPENIFLTRDGQVKILDFGLARSTDPWQESEAVSLSPTVGHRTAAGTVLGTVGYMSPEQVRGEPADERSDIFSLGAVLYEMLTGRRAFSRDTGAETMTAILREDPPEIEETGRQIPPAGDRIVRRCLEKRPAERFQSARDLAFALEAVSVSSIVSAPPAEASRSRRGGLLALAAAAGIVVGVLAAVFLQPRGNSPTGQPVFRELTFRKGYVSSARLASDGLTVVYGTSFGGGPITLLSTRTDSIESRELDLPPADILGISKTGTMAILLNRRRKGSWVSIGTLARVDLAGGSPRPILENVNAGDISPDGTSLAVVRTVGGTQQLEYPIGKVLLKTTGWISNVRIAPDGERVALIFHRLYGDDRGLVAVARKDGKITHLTDDYPNGMQGLAWSPDGTAIWFSSELFAEGGVVESVRPGERARTLLRIPSAVRLQDVSREGRMLIISGASRAEIAGRLAGDDRDRRYEWWANDYVGAIAANGRSFAGDEQETGAAEGEYIAYVRKNDGSPPIRLGPASTLGMSPRGEWVFATTLSQDRDRLLMFPTGVGRRREISLGGVRPVGAGYTRASCTADGRMLAFTGLTSSEGRRGYLLDLETEELRAVTPEGISQSIVSPDGAWLTGVDDDGRLWIFRTGKGEPVQVTAVRPGEVPLAWSTDNRALFVWDRSFPARILRIGIADGRRQKTREIMPEDPAGVLYGSIVMAPGGRYYLYRIRRSLNTLHLVEGVS